MKKTYFLKIWGILFTLLPLLNGCIREEEFNNTPQKFRGIMENH